MGRSSRRRQARLAEKLRAIRLTLNVSQADMIRLLGLEGELDRNNLSNYETGEREPPLFVLLRYGKAAGVCLDYIIDDELDLPKKLYLRSNIQHKKSTP